MNQLDQDIHDLREDKKVLVALERLLINPDFAKVILGDFLTKHPLRLLEGKGRLQLDPQTNQDIDRQLDSVAMFKMYLDNRKSQITDIEHRISEAERLRDEQTRNT